MIVCKWSSRWWSPLKAFHWPTKSWPGNTTDKTTLKEFLHKIEMQYGKAERIWVMDRGIPTEEVLSEMRQSRSAG